MICVYLLQAAIDSLTRSLCLEWGPEYGIRVNGIAPGPVANTAGASKLSISANAESVEDRFRSMIPIGRLGSTWDIAMAAVFLVVSFYAFGLKVVDLCLSMNV